MMKIRPIRRSRHLRSQMKFFSGKRFKDSLANAFWKQGTKPRDGYSKIFN